MYKFDCFECLTTYVGETMREVDIRLGEHKAPIDAILKKKEKDKKNCSAP